MKIGPIDVPTLGAALVLSAQHADAILPAVTSADVGEQLVVGSDGKWAKGAASTATISVSDHTLTIASAP